MRRDCKPRKPADLLAKRCHTDRAALVRQSAAARPVRTPRVLFSVSHLGTKISRRPSVDRVIAALVAAGGDARAAAGDLGIDLAGLLALIDARGAIGRRLQAVIRGARAAGDVASADSAGVARGVLLGIASDPSLEPRDRIAAAGRLLDGAERARTADDAEARASLEAALAELRR